MSRCLVLGGAGFIGSHICEALLRAGHQVRIFTRPGQDTPQLRRVLEGADWIPGDFTSPERLGRLVEGVDVVIHSLSTTLPKTSNDDMVYDVTSNVVPTLRLLAAASAAGVKRVVYLSSGGTVYGIPRAVPITEDHPTDPVCSYGIQKLAIEKYLALHERMTGLRHAVMRISNPYGERQRPLASQGVVSIFLYKASRGIPIEIYGDGSIVRDYLHVSDVARAAIALLDYEGPQRVFNVGSGTGHSLVEIVGAIEQVEGKKVEVRFQPARPFDVPVNVLDVTRAAKELGWRPQVSFGEGLQRTLNALLAKDGALEE